MIAITALLLLALRGLTQPGHKKRLAGIVIAALVLASLSLVGGALLPIPKPFKITGPYQVGTTIFPLVDTSREEIYAAEANQPREIMVQVWYPAEPKESDTRSQWMPDIKVAGPAIADWISLPSFALNHLEYAKGNAFLGAPAASGGEKFPLLVFSHGWSGFKEQNIYQVEELASHGYVVVGINHTYGAVVTVFPDGRQLYRNDNALPDGVSDEAYHQASNLLVRQWAGDIGFVLDEFALLDRKGSTLPFAGSYDLDRVGIFGHSTGGGATAEFCGTDARCKAALAMDLWIEPVSSEVVSAGLTQPYLFLHSDTWATESSHNNNYSLIGELVANSQVKGTEIMIKGTQHYDFTSIPLFTPLASAIGLKGPIPGDSGLRLINYYSVAFFDHALRGSGDDPLKSENSPSDYAEFISRP
ncbi:MAG: alpha/beta hydrolase family protein [Anaerolineales bacterium]